jgi:Short C-terminal domain
MNKTGLVLITACIVLSGCVSWNRGLEPIQPKYSAYSWSEKVDTLKPRLEWSPYKNTSGKQDFRYQLQIIDGNVVRLFKDGIHDTYYVVDEPLLPNKVYQWAVRAAWTSDGKTEGERWNDKKYFYLSPVLFGWGSKPYLISTPDVVAYSSVEAKQGVAVEQPKTAIVADDSAMKRTTLEPKTPPARTASSKSDDAVTLEKLNSLHIKGIINDEEYSRKKKEILDRM